MKNITKITIFVNPHSESVIDKQDQTTAMEL